MILVHARGNETIGIGNLSRSYELIIHLLEKHDVIGIFECNNYLFKKFSHKKILRSNSLSQSLSIIKKYKNSLYVCDLVDPNKELSTQLKEYGIKKTFYFNDLENGFEPDVLFLTNSFDYLFKAKEFELYRGFEYYIVGNKILKNRKKIFEPKERIKNILVCFGGADPAFYSEYMATNIQNDSYSYTIILGPAMSQDRKNTIIKIKKQNIQYIENPKNIIELYNKSDLLVTLGGMMTYEAMCIGLPVCAIRWTYLEYIVKSFGEKKMISDLGNTKNAYKNLLSLDIQKVNEIAQNAFKIIDGSALKNIEKVIEKNL